MEIDKDLIQDVIDRLLKHGRKYSEELKKLNKKYPVKYKMVNEKRSYLTSKDEDAKALANDKNCSH